eukprot:3448275-Heterocapsa_arctica.AAC.1
MERKRHIIDMKLEKTRVWDHMVQAKLSPNLLVYIDEDLIVLRPVSILLDFLNTQHPNDAILMFHDSKTPRLAHGGLVASRKVGRS